MHRYLRKNIGGKYVNHCHFLVNKWHRSYSESSRNLIEKYGKEKWKVFHNVRDPIARNLSHFWAGEFVRNVRPRKPDLANFKERFLIETDHHYGLYFIAREIIPFWGIDIPFKKNWRHKDVFTPPYSIYGERIAILRYEDFDSLKDLMYEFLGLKEKSKPERMRCSGRAGEADDFKEILNTIRLPENYVDVMYNNAFMITFYSREEIKVLKERWTKGTKPDHPIIRKQEAFRDMHDPKTCPECIEFRKRRAA